MPELRQVEKTTGKPPPELIGAPELWPENVIAWRAWIFLHEMRMSGETIRLADLESYARIYALAAVSIAEKIKIVERAYLSDQAERNKSK